jgi:hypothetical protein
MSAAPFPAIDSALASGGPEAVFQSLIQHCMDTRNYPLLLETRLMQVRHELGLPLLQSSASAMPEQTRRRYDEAFIDAARQVGNLFLADGNIPRAWPYFRAVGEGDPVAKAIDDYQPGDDLDAVIEIALLEAVNPTKGFRLILENHGICRAITCYSQFPARQGRLDCARLLVSALHSELRDNLRRSIGDDAGDVMSIPELIEGRQWLFGEYSYHVDTSHLVSVLQIAIELDDAESLSKALEIALYGEHLAPTFQHRGDPPFENVYSDHAVYLRALLGQHSDAAVAHFRDKASNLDPAGHGYGPAQVLVTLLVRLGRYQEAIEASLRFLSEAPPHELGCPGIPELCQMAGDFTRLRELALEKQDPLSYTAALLQAS